MKKNISGCKLQKLMDRDEEKRLALLRNREFEKEAEEHAKNLVKSLRKIKPDKAFDDLIKNIK